MFGTGFVCRDTPRGISHASYKICQPGAHRLPVRAFFRAVRVTDGSVRARFRGRGVTGGRCAPNCGRCGVISPPVRAQAGRCGLFPGRCAPIYVRCEEITAGAAENRDARRTGRGGAGEFRERCGGVSRAGGNFCVDAARDIHIMRRRRTGAARNASRGG